LSYDASYISFANNFLVKILVSAPYCLVFTVPCFCIAVNKIKTLLWHMQEDLESFGQWELGEAEAIPEL
jgi:hypothetical protein